MEHARLKLGKAPAEYDPGALKLSSVLRLTAPPPPLAYDFDDAHPKEIPIPMFANDQFGDCVMAGRAHQQLRFEHLEQGATPTITDQDVIDEYFRETGGEDAGLVVIRSLREWRGRGWVCGDLCYRIKAFATVNVRNPYEIRQAIFSNLGVGVGLQLPITASQQFDHGKPWDIVVPSSEESAKGSWGGHYVFCPAYNAIGPICITWGQRQQMTWAWFTTYADEAYAIWDAPDRHKGRGSIIDWQAVLNYITTHARLH